MYSRRWRRQILSSLRLCTRHRRSISPTASRPMARRVFEGEGTALSQCGSCITRLAGQKAPQKAPQAQAADATPGTRCGQVPWSKRGYVPPSKGLWSRMARHKKHRSPTSPFVVLYGAGTCVRCGAHGGGGGGWWWRWRVNSKPPPLQLYRPATPATVGHGQASFPLPLPGSNFEIISSVPGRPPWPCMWR
jgi:hypothetical protein